jgi:uncharacterized membrane protein YsdA (DUF1294 family)/cold shock CspA family protein
VTTPTESIRGVITEWSEARGFGFIDDGRRRIFLHRRDFRQHHKTPAKGDVVDFVVGSDAQGRTCATQAELVNDGGRFRSTDAVWLALLLVAPGMALARWSHAFEVRWVIGVAVSVSVITYLCYRSDKARARAKVWRVPETTLHLLEIHGGWPGGFIAQRQLRHKVSKLRYQVVFWLIVGAYQYVSIDSLLAWQMTNRARAFISAPAPVPR